MRAVFGLVVAGLVAGATLSAHTHMQPPSGSGQPAAAGATPAKTLTVIGCIGGGANAQPFTLTSIAPTEGQTDVNSAASVATPPPTSGQTGTPPVAGTAGVTPINGYRLIAKEDLNAWLGKRVRLVGSVVPPTAPAGASESASGATGTPAAASPASVVQMPEFRVTSIEPAAGECPQR